MRKRAIESRYEFYEVVTVKSGSASGLEGAVVGRAQEENRWYYAVYIYEHGEVWSLPEEYLEPTGRTDERATFYDGTSVKVRVDPETGEGSVAD